MTDTPLDRVEKLIEIPLVSKAFTFASAAHSAVNQKRKYSGAPYIVHPVEVCAIVSSVDHTKEMLAAALLHDTVEDTAVSLELIESHFGATVMNLVYWLTDVSVVWKDGKKSKVEGNRAARKEMDRRHTHMAPKAAQTIKVADLIANTRDITEADPSFGKVYMAEKRLLLEGMDADEVLMEYAWNMIRDWEKENA